MHCSFSEQRGNVNRHRELLLARGGDQQIRAPDCVACDLTAGGPDTNGIDNPTFHPIGSEAICRR
jgi:hypothetical protein